MSQYQNRPKEVKGDKWSFRAEVFFPIPIGALGKTVLLSAMKDRQAIISNRDHDPSVLKINFTIGKGSVSDLVPAATATLNLALHNSCMTDTTIINMSATPIINGNEDPGRRQDLFESLIAYELSQYAD